MVLNPRQLLSERGSIELYSILFYFKLSPPEAATLPRLARSSRSESGADCEGRALGELTAGALGTDRTS